MTKLTKNLNFVCEHCQKSFSLLACRMKGRTGRRGRFCSHPCYLKSKAVAPKDAFLACIDKTESCWIWIGSRRGKYGQITIKQVTKLAHRFSWELHFGPVPQGKWVCHNCPTGDNPLCVNPAHLWLGTPKQNTHDMMSKGRNKIGDDHHYSIYSDHDAKRVWNEFNWNTPVRGLKIRIARELGLSKYFVYQVLQGRIRQHVMTTSKQLSHNPNN